MKVSLDAQASLAPTPFPSSVGWSVSYTYEFPFCQRLWADMEVDVVADMEVDMVVDIDININIPIWWDEKIGNGGWLIFDMKLSRLAQVYSYFFFLT